MCTIKSIKNYMVDSFWEFVGNQLDKEEQDREHKIQNGEIVRGRDTVLIWENKFEIWKHNGEKRLSIKDNNLSSMILDKIINYNIIDGKLYINSEEGLAILDKNNLCRAFITIDDDKFVNGYSIDEKGNKRYMSRYVENGHIKYLEKYEYFSEEERVVFDKIK